MSLPGLHPLDISTPEGRAASKAQASARRLTLLSQDVTCLFNVGDTAGLTSAQIDAKVPGARDGLAVIDNVHSNLLVRMGGKWWRHSAAQIA